MMNFFETLIEYIRIAWEFFLNFLQSLVIFLNTVLSATALPAYLSVRVPSFLSAAILGVFAIAAVKLIIGRDNA